MAPELRDMTAKYAAITAATAFVTQPIPGLEEVFLIPLQGWFAWKFMKRRGYQPKRGPWFTVGVILGAGLGARILSRVTLGFVPPAGAFANAVTAAAGTVLIATFLDKEGPPRASPEP
jgi:hypothetical protein